MKAHLATPRMGIRAIIVAWLSLAATGCSSVPRGQLEDSRKQVMALRAELAQTKDVAARLRTENRDMAARSVEESRRLAAIEESNERLEKSVSSYQEERDQYASALDQIKSAIVSSRPSDSSATRR